MLALVAVGLMDPAAALAQTADWPARASVGVQCLQAFEAAENPLKDDATRLSESTEAARQLETVKNPQGKPLWASCYEAVPEVCAEAAQAPSDPNSAPVLAMIKTCLRHRRAGLTAGATPMLGAEIVRSVAQVVVTKAQAAGWGLLVTKLKKLAHCELEAGEDATVRLARTCDVIDSLSIKDLVSSPMVLLTAAVQDLLEAMAPANKTLGTSSSKLVLAEVTARWPHGGTEGVPAAVKAALTDIVHERASGACNAASEISVKYAYVVGMCLVQHLPKQLSKCDASGLIARCGADSQQTLERLWDLTTALYPETGQPKPTDAINLAFALAQAELDARPGDNAAAQEYLTATKDLLTGLVSKDWVAATSGGVRILELRAEKKHSKVETCDDASTTCKQAKVIWDHALAFRLFAAVGNYALTFDRNQSSDPAASAAAREKIITELVDRMVNRTDRDSGAVVSLGGTLGLLGGTRFAEVAGDLEWDPAFPVQLALGLGVQTYGSDDGGFHLLISALDVGQYISFNENLQVDTPDVETALQCGLSLGYWFALRETPLHIAAHGSVAPFNRASSNPTFQLGLALGIYVPLLDFN